jgi:hypothetical protein
MTIQHLSDSELQTLGKILSQQVEAAIAAWELGVKCLKINSKPYKALCKSGRQLQESYHCFLTMAEDRWSAEEVRKYFTVTVGCGFN